jgi:hypothetical protein
MRDKRFDWTGLELDVEIPSSSERAPHDIQGFFSVPSVALW